VELNLIFHAALENPPLYSPDSIKPYSPCIVAIALVKVTAVIVGVYVVPPAEVLPR
jgi:hypothetical protein